MDRGEDFVVVKDLKVRYPGRFCMQPVSFAVRRAETVVVVGESGSGKTTLAKAVYGITDSTAEHSGDVWIDGIDVYAQSEKAQVQSRYRDYAICFQNSGELLNPLLTIRTHIMEVLQKKIKSRDSNALMFSLLQEVGLDETVLGKYPHELSGGMLQRVLLVCAVALRPKFVILDEPASSLDDKSKELIIRYIKRLQKDCGMSFLIVTHDLKAARLTGDRLLVMYQGLLVELGNAGRVLTRPGHPYTKGLIQASTDLYPYRDMWGIRNPYGAAEDQTEEGTGCPFYSRCTQRADACSRTLPLLKACGLDEDRLVACNRGGIVRILEADGISKAYHRIKVLDNVSLTIEAGEIVSLVGDSGIGKTTLSNILAGFLDADKGKVLFMNRPANYRKLHRSRQGMQMVFQDPNTSMNPRFTVREVIEEPLILSDESIHPGAASRIQQVRKVLVEVGLPCHDTFLNAGISGLSGGERQRVSVARALVMEPALLVADEPTSMLDASSKANMLRMLKGLQNAKGFSMLMVTHDLSVAMKISDRVFRIHEGGVLLEESTV